MNPINSRAKKPCFMHVFVLILLSCFHLSTILASSRGPPPPPPPPRNSDGRTRNTHTYERDQYRDRGRVRGPHNEQRRRNDYQRRDDDAYSYSREGRRDYPYRDSNRSNRDRMDPRINRDRDPYRYRNDREEYDYEYEERNEQVTRRRREDVPMDPSRRQKPSTSSSYNPFKRKSEPDNLFKTAKGLNFGKRDEAESDYGENKDEQVTNDAVLDNSEKRYNPIDYQFPSKEMNDNNANNNSQTEEDELPQTGLGLVNDEERSTNGDTVLRPMPQYASARKDAVARYSSTSLGKLKLLAATYVVGGAIGGFLGQSLFHQGKFYATIFGFTFLMLSFLRNDYGEMSRCLGLALIYLIRRTTSVRRRYRTGAHLRGMCRIGPRKPFPPVQEGEEENPWKYVPQAKHDPDFDMIRAMASVVLVGSFCGGTMQLPLIPQWVGGTAGAATFAVFGISKNPRGDLIRTMGMRIVTLAGEAMAINSELRVARKVARVGGKIFDKMMILDRKHRIKDRIVSGATWAYEKASNTAAQVQEDVKEGRENRKD